MTQKQHDTEKLRKEGTGRWFLESDKFIEWQDNPGLLWIEGPCKPVSWRTTVEPNLKAAGAGKSVLR